MNSPIVLYNEGFICPFFCTVIKSNPQLYLFFFSIIKNIQIKRHFENFCVHIVFGRTWSLNFFFFFIFFLSQKKKIKNVVFDFLEGKRGGARLEFFFYNFFFQQKKKIHS